MALIDDMGNIFITNNANTLIGLMENFSRVLMYLPLLFLANYVELRERKKGIFLIWAMPAAFILLFMVLIIYLFSIKSPSFTFFAFYFLYPGYHFFFGALALMVNDICGKIVPIERRNGFYGVRFAYGAIGTMLIGITARSFFAYQGENIYRDAYVPVLLIAEFFIFIAWIAIMIIREPVHSIRTKRKPIGEFLKDAFQLVLKKDKNFRAFYIMRIFQYMGYYMAFTFFALYMAEELGLPLEVFGMAIFMQAGVNFFGFFIFGRIGNRLGTKIILQISNITGFIGLTGFVFIPNMVVWYMNINPDVGYITVAKTFYLFFFMFIQMSYQTTSIGRMAYALDIAPKELRPTYLGFAQTGLVPFLIICMFNGLIADLLSRRFLFGICAVLFLCALTATHWMENVRKKRL